MSGLIAIVGRPNVGKSALFNRLAGRRIAIVHDQPGVTRDRISAEAEWHGRRFTLVDTGGIGLAPGEKAPDALAAAALSQVDLAIEAAAVIVLVVDAQEGVVPLDEAVAARLRRSGKPVLVAANKADNPALELNAAEFARLGFEPVFPVSAVHGHGVDALVEAAASFGAGWLGDSLTLAVLASRVLKVAKRFFGVPAFASYALADGLRGWLWRFPAKRPRSAACPVPSQLWLFRFT